MLVVCSLLILLEALSATRLSIILLDFFFRMGNRNEETTTALANQHLAAILEFPAAIFGYGFYGYGGFEPHSDSGFARMFMSVGMPLGLVTIQFLSDLSLDILRLENHCF